MKVLVFGTNEEACLLPAECLLGLVKKKKLIKFMEPHKFLDWCQMFDLEGNCVFDW